MGEWNAIDCVTRLPIFEGEKVFAIYARHICEGKGKKRVFRYNPISLFGSGSVPNCWNHVRFYFGTFCNYRRHGLHEFDNVEGEKMYADGLFALMHVETLEYIQHESKNHPTWLQKYVLDEKHDDIGKELIDHDYLWDRTKQEFKDILTTYGVQAFEWAVGQYERDEMDATGREMTGKQEFIFMIRFEENVIHNKRSRKKIDMERFERYAKDWTEYVFPFAHFCNTNHVRLDSNFEGHQVHGNEELAANARFAKFVLGQSQKIKKEQRDAGLV